MINKAELISVGVARRTIGGSKLGVGKASRKEVSSREGIAPDFFLP
ncbi:MAG: hypothetical protein RMY64_29990 [Nostoc sp. DedQUE08]|nr:MULTISPECIES: hypothetical protein [unclassified Nostoc]MDZ8033398.1 hypothetical protein [Nostoc sp. DedSLP04]MDZ8069792.1 hypothetical protein [Nostoc sp. DedQUE08]MDZ8138973.1 hypothetical protein [Nostoc sp. DedQUE04]